MITLSLIFGLILLLQQPDIIEEIDLLQLSDEVPTTHLSDLPGGSVSTASKWGYSYDEQDDQVLFGEVSHMALGKGRELFVLDNTRNTILHFDPEGNLLDEIGREGEGPGEFRTPAAIQYEDESLIVAENNGRIHRFSRQTNEIVLDDTYQLDLHIDDLCLKNGEVYLMGFTSGNDHIIHKTEDNLQDIASSFGSAFDHDEEAIVSDISRRGSLECTGSYVLAAFEYGPVISVYDSDGRKVQQFVLEDMTTMDINLVEMPGGGPGVNVAVPEEGYYDRINQITATDEDKFLVQTKREYHDEEKAAITQTHLYLSEDHYEVWETASGMLMFDFRKDEAAAGANFPHPQFELKKLKSNSEK